MMKREEEKLRIKPLRTQLEQVAAPGTRILDYTDSYEFLGEKNKLGNDQELIAAGRAERAAMRAAIP